jgi:hypothetical protein
VSYVSLVLTLLMLLSIPAAYVEAAQTAPALVDAIEQTQQSIGGVTYFRLVGVTCPARTDGFFTLASDTKQPLMLEILLTAFERGLRVDLVYEQVPSFCNVSTIMVCATGSSLCHE